MIIVVHGVKRSFFRFVRKARATHDRVEYHIAKKTRGMSFSEWRTLEITMMVRKYNYKHSIPIVRVTCHDVTIELLDTPRSTEKSSWHQLTVNHPIDCCESDLPNSHSIAVVKSYCTMARLTILLTFLLASIAQAFVPASPGSFAPASLKPSFDVHKQQQSSMPAALQRQRKSVAPVQTMGLFGLGVPEIGVILVAAAFLLGPQKLAELGKDAGKIAGELKEVPKEFSKGLEEGEARAKALKEDIENEE